MSADRRRWFLINASPDLRAQIEAFPALQPGPINARHSPIEGVLLTNADLDHVLGLFLLREGGRVAIHATEAVRESLELGLNFAAVLGAFAGASWTSPGTDFQPLHGNNGPSGLSVRAIPLPGGPPRYLRAGSKYQAGHSIAWQIVDDRTGGRLLVAPDVAGLTGPFEAALSDSSAVLFDGTFWSENELRAIDPGARTAREMGHLPVAGGSLEILRSLSAAHRIYLHINNTNPMLDPRSAPHAEVTASGIAVGEDGFSFEL